MVISIIKAEYIENYKINFLFSDGVVRELDFHSFLSNAKNPMIRKYLDKNLFRKFSVHYGDIMWNDFELCFPIQDVYEGRI